MCCGAESATTGTSCWVRPCARARPSRCGTGPRSWPGSSCGWACRPGTWPPAAPTSSPAPSCPRSPTRRYRGRSVSTFYAQDMDPLRHDRTGADGKCLPLLEDSCKLSKVPNISVQRGDQTGSPNSMSRRTISVGKGN